MPQKHPQRLMPSAALKAGWREAARSSPTARALKTRAALARAVRAYEQRWLAVWRTTVDLALEQLEWDEVGHLWLVADFVEARRLAYEHQLAADHEGRYSHNDAGRHFAHPGIDKAREARKEAREIAAALGITPEAMRNAGIEDPPDPDEPQGDQAGL